MLVTNARQVNYPIQKNDTILPYARSHLQAKLKKWLSRPALLEQQIQLVHAIRQIVPINDIKTAKIFNQLLAKHGTQCTAISPYLLNDEIRQNKWLYQLDHLDHINSPNYLIPKTELLLDIQDEYSLVHSRLTIQRNHSNTPRKLILQGKNLDVQSLSINGQRIGLDQIELSQERLVISPSLLPSEQLFIIETCVRHLPKNNKTGFGLYEDNGVLSTHCDSGKFCQITYFIESPVNRTIFNVEAKFNPNRYPIILSNGDQYQIFQNEENIRHVKISMDTPIPSYLFAFLAGNLDSYEEIYQSINGKQIRVQAFSKPKKLNDFTWVVTSSIKTMQWLEANYQFEYQRDILKLAAIENLDCCAMENEGLIFCSEEIFTNRLFYSGRFEYYASKAIPHEIIHHFIGNAVTVPSFFFSAFKEGLTSYLEFQFMKSVLPDEIPLFYLSNQLNLFPPFINRESALVPALIKGEFISPCSEAYDLGLQVFLMLEKMLGDENLKEGIIRFFNKHKGQAAAFDEFFLVLQNLIEEKRLAAINFDQFSSWIYEKDIPQVLVEMDYDSEKKQACFRTTQLVNAQPFTFPMCVGFLNQAGNEIVPTQTCIITENSQEIYFEGIHTQPIPSLFRDISAPIIWVHKGNQIDDLITLIKHDTSYFNRFKAAHDLWMAILVSGKINNDSFKQEALSPTETQLIEVFTFVMNQQIPAHVKFSILNVYRWVDYPSANLMTIFVNLCKYLEQPVVDLLTREVTTVITESEKLHHGQLLLTCVKMLKEAQLSFAFFREVFQQCHYAREKLELVNMMSNKFPTNPGVKPLLALIKSESFISFDEHIFYLRLLAKHDPKKLIVKAKRALKNFPTLNRDQVINFSKALISHDVFHSHQGYNLYFTLIVQNSSIAGELLPTIFEIFEKINLEGKEVLAKKLRRLLNDPNFPEEYKSQIQSVFKKVAKDL